MKTLRQPIRLKLARLSVGRKMLAQTFSKRICFIMLGILIFGTLFLGILWISLPCFFAKATGLLCPGCGGTRAIKHLLQGNMTGGFQCNLLLPFLCLIAIACCFKTIRKHIVGPHIFILVISISPILFVVLRNLPFDCFDFLRPPF